MKRPRLVDAAFIAIPLVVAAVAIAQSWNGWLDPIVDTGRDLYIPEQIRHGAKLYRDFAYYYPPLTPYLLAAITALTGSSLAAYTAIGAATAFATIVVLYVLGTVVGGRYGGVCASGLFAACSIAGRSTWGTNYIFPYAHAATIGMFFFIAFVTSLAIYVYVSRTRAWILAALACALAGAWTKVEYAAFTAVVLVFAVIVHRIEWRWVLTFAAAAAASLGVVALIFRDTRWFTDNIAPQSLLGSPYLRSFYRAVSGVDDWPRLLMRSAIAAAILVVFAVMARQRRALFVIGAMVAAVALLAYEDGFFRAWTILQLALIPYAMRRPRDPLTLVLIASLCTTSRVFFNIVPVWYGFVFLVPLYVLAACVLLRFTPARLAVSLLAAVGVLSLIAAHDAYARKTVVTTTDRGAFKDSLPDRAAAIKALQGLPMRSFVVVPEGLTLNYLLRAQVPIRYHTFTPPEAADPGMETRILEEFELKRPEWVLIVPRPVGEFGARGFGMDYGQRFATYLRARYAAEQRVGGPEFSIFVLRRR